MDDPSQSAVTAAAPIVTPAPPAAPPAHGTVAPAPPGSGGPGPMRWVAVVAIAVVVAVAAGVGGAVGAWAASPDDLVLESVDELRPDVPFPDDPGEFDDFDGQFPGDEFPEDEFGEEEFREEPDNGHGDATSAEEPIARFEVRGGRLAGDAASDHVRQANKIWTRFVELIPPDQRQMVQAFELLDEGYEGAHVYPDERDPSKWTIGVGLGLGSDLDFVLIHEFAHLLTLHAGQAPPDLGSEAGCQTFFTGEGCALAQSTIARFVDRFWPADLQDQVFEIEAIEDEDRYLDALDRFYVARADDFVTDYAATNPGEDLAETFTAFVLADRPAGDSISDQKVQFLWEDARLVALRDQIRSAR